MWLFQQKGPGDVKKMLVLIIKNTEDIFSDFWPLIKEEFERAATQSKKVTIAFL